MLFKPEDLVNNIQVPIPEGLGQAEGLHFYLPPGDADSAGRGRAPAFHRHSSE